MKTTNPDAEIKALCKVAKANFEVYKLNYEDDYLIAAGKAYVHAAHRVEQLRIEGTKVHHTELNKLFVTLKYYGAFKFASPGSNKIDHVSTKSELKWLRNAIDNACKAALEAA